MPRIQDIGAFNAVRESGLAKLVPAVPRLTVGWYLWAAATELKSSSMPQRAIQASGLDVQSRSRVFRLLFSGTARQCSPARQPAGVLHRVQAHDAAAFSKAISTGIIPSDLIYCKIEEWDQITAFSQIRAGLPRYSTVHTISVL